MSECQPAGKGFGCKFLVSQISASDQRAGLPVKERMGRARCSPAHGERKALAAPWGQDPQAGRKQSISLVLPAKPQHVLGFRFAKNLGLPDSE